MKSIIKTLLLLLVIAPTITTAAIYSSSELDSAADSLGDVIWGDFDWDHDNLQCDFEAKKCSMDLTLIDKHYYDGEMPQDLSELMNKLSKNESIDFDPDSGEVYILYRGVCEIPNVEKVSDVAPNGHYSRHLKSSIMDCVDEIQDDYRAIL